MHGIQGLPVAKQEIDIWAKPPAQIFWYFKFNSIADFNSIPIRHPSDIVASLFAYLRKEAKPGTGGSRL
jgi:hypothetical protein